MNRVNLKTCFVRKLHPRTYFFEVVLYESHQEHRESFSISFVFHFRAENVWESRSGDILFLGDVFVMWTRRKSCNLGNDIVNFVEKGSVKLTYRSAGADQDNLLPVVSLNSG